MCQLSYLPLPQTAWCSGGRQWACSFEDCRSWHSISLPGQSSGRLPEDLLTPPNWAVLERGTVGELNPQRAVHPHARRGNGSETEAKAATATAKNGNMENVKAWFHVRVAEADRQAGAAWIFFSLGGAIHAAAKGLSQRKRGVAEFPPKFSPAVPRSG